MNNQLSMREMEGLFKLKTVMLTFQGDGYLVVDIQWSRWTEWSGMIRACWSIGCMGRCTVINNQEESLV